MECGGCRGAGNGSSQSVLESVDDSFIHDRHLAKILFLSIKPKQGTDLCLPFLNQSDSDPMTDLTGRFKQTLKDGNLSRLRKTLKVRLIALKQLKTASLPTTTLEQNFSDENDALSEEEEDILEFNAIFEMLSIPIEDFLKDRFMSIVKSKSISVRKEGEDIKKTLFLYSESQVLSEICDMLDDQDVIRMYNCLKSQKDNSPLIEELRSLDVEEVLSEKENLKDVAFYYLMLKMIEFNYLNRLYTHILENVLQEVKVTYESEGVASLNRFTASVKKLKRYPMSSVPPGICIIFCMIENRQGANNDLEIVKRLFEKMYSYDVIVKIDPSSTLIQNIATKLQFQRHKFYDSLIVWFMGHGDSENLKTSDKLINRRKEFIDPFVKIDWLNKKPKIFFIQACQSKEVNHEELQSLPPPRSPGIEAEKDASKVCQLGAYDEWKRKYSPYVDTTLVNNYADTLISYATKWEEKAARNKEGSLYVQTVVDQMKKFGHLESIENVLRNVHYNTNSIRILSEGETQWKQTPYYESSLQKEFIFPSPTKGDSAFDSSESLKRQL